MFSTKPVKSLQNLFSAFHQPAPLSKQQSEKIVDGLKRSFRQQLDREYGHSTEAPATPAKRTDTDERIRHSAASQHLKSILSNPLFNYSKQPGSTLSTTLPTPSRDPMDVFDHAVAKGMMTLPAAAGCLVAKNKQMTTSPLLQDLSSSETAVRVVRWLRSSGTEDELQFLDNRPFVRALAPFLVAEGLEPVAWNWIARAMEDSSGRLPDSRRLKRASFLLAALVRIKSQPHYGNLNAAITMILDAEQRFQANPLLSRLLVHPWRSVSWLSTVESFGRTSPSEALFDAHMATAERLPQGTAVETAHLHLYHPTHPDSTQALDLFRNKEALWSLLGKANPSHIKAAAHSGMGLIPWIAVLGQDTVNYLAQSGRRDDAEDISEILESDLAGIMNGTYMKPV